MRKFQFAVPAALAVCLSLSAQDLASLSRDTDAVVQEAVAKGQIPGAVLLVGHAGKVVFTKAYGSRSLVPTREPMTEDTIFDLASLTKVV
ncbi:MAG TPA: serine hydrolase domain-containing protein, partial [Bryobacteraceae bacterium]|nr:serine hydrolase domain-containing protein [Bryobacteraceae bacterium]